MADELPADLDITGYVGTYSFPDNSRRRVPGALYLAAAALTAAVWAATGGDGVFVNRGVLIAAIALALIGAYHLQASWRLGIRETAALAAAAREVGFPVGHASAQLSWRGLRSRPTWRILVYSAEDTPKQRGIVLVDGVDGRVIEHFVEPNPEDWSTLKG